MHGKFHGGWICNPQANQKEMEEIEQDLERAFLESGKEINSYYRKERNDVGSSNSSETQTTVYPQSTHRVTAKPKNNPGGYVVKPMTKESIEVDLERALTETKRDLDARRYSTGANVPANDVGSQGKVVAVASEPNQKKTYGPNLPEDPYEKVKYELDEDDFIDKTYHKYADYDYYKYYGPIAEAITQGRSFFYINLDLDCI